MKLVPFNLDAAKAGAPVQTEHGAAARLVLYDETKNGTVVSGFFTAATGADALGYWDANGAPAGDPDTPSLVMAYSDCGPSLWEEPSLWGQEYRRTALLAQNLRQRRKGE